MQNMIWGINSQIICLVMHRIDLFLLSYLQFPPSNINYIRMGKKPMPEANKLKKIRSKHKQFFPQLATHQQEIVQRNIEAKKVYHKRVIEEDSEQQVELDVLQHQNNDLDMICQTVHRLLSKNKVSAKNAFDVPLIDLQQLPDFTGSLENEYAWKKLSSTLENDYRIYAYRVDAIHSITYNILHTMSRRQQDIDALQNPPPEIPNQALPLQPQKQNLGVEGQHLQRKIENLNLAQFELVLGVDPILQRNKRKFDQLGAQNMLLNSLSVNDDLALELVKNISAIKKLPPWGEYTDTWSADDPLMAFIELAEFRATIQESLEGKMRDEEVYDLFMGEKENYFYQNYQAIQLENEILHKQKEIGREIKWKAKHSSLRMNQIIDEADNWMEDRQFPFRKNAIKSENIAKNQIKYENPEDLVNFELNDAQEDTRNSVFLKQNDKAEFKEEIQDKFLLASRLPYNFEIQKYPLTLKEIPRIEVKETQKNVEVDVRRQIISISDAKKKMKDLIHSRSTFRTLYTGYQQFDDISPALCFLTMLHLANQYGLSLDQIDQSNFYIR